MGNTARLLEGRRIALVGFGTESADRLRGTVEAEGARCRVESGGACGPLLATLERFDAVVLHLDGETSPALATAVLQSSASPVLIMGSEESIRTRVASLRLPARSFALDTCSGAELVLRLASFPSAGVHMERPAGPLVVLADDDAVATGLLENMLGHYGIACHVAANGDEALTLARRFQPDAMVLDVNMPGRDGFEVLQEFRADSQTAGIRVLLLTGRADEADVRRGQALGADAYVVKPFKARDVAARVQALVGLERAARAS